MIVKALLRLASLAALVVAGWWISRLLRGGRRSQAARRPARAASDGPMVRDRVCNTFLPRASAIEARIGGETHFFCSEACHRRFLGESGTARSA